VHASNYDDVPFKLTTAGEVDGINLEIKHLNRDDAGNYICEVENSGEPVLQTNTLQVLG